MYVPPAMCVQAKKNKQAISKSGRDNTTVVKQETQRAENPSPSSGWKNNAKPREGQDASRLAVKTAPAKTSNGVDTGARGRGGRGSRGPSRGGGKAKQAKPADADGGAAVVRSPDGRRQREKVPEVTTPVPQAAERKEEQSQDLSSSVRKSPRSKEVCERFLFVCPVLCTWCPLCCVFFVFLVSVGCRCLDLFGIYFCSTCRQESTAACVTRSK